MNPMDLELARLQAYNLVAERLRDLRPQSTFAGTMLMRVLEYLCKTQHA